MGKDLKEYEILAAEIFFTPERDISPLLKIGMNINSAKDTMRCYEHLINGKLYSRSIQQNVIIALFEKLFRDQNFEVIPNVIKSLEENFEIRLAKYNDSKIGARRIVDEYKNKWLLLSGENEFIIPDKIPKESEGPIQEVQKQGISQRTSMNLLEKDMEDLIIENPQKYLGETGLKLISRQYSIGNYRFDLLFDDRHGAKLIVEIQRGTLDRNHIYKIFDYFDEFKTKHPHEFIELMIVANKITRERRNRLKSYGVSFKEIPESIFLEDLASKVPITPSTQTIETTSFSNSHNGKERFERLLSAKSWHDECHGKTELTFHRLLQLKAILEKYSWEIPYSHFNNETINDSRLRNSQIFPIICAYHAGYFVMGRRGLSLKEERKNDFEEINERPSENSTLNITTITLTEGSISNNYLNLSEIRDFFPADTIGGSSKDELAPQEISINWGDDEPIITDIAGDKMIFRKRGWVGEFIARFQLKSGDKVVLHKDKEYAYTIRPLSPNN